MNILKRLFKKKAPIVDWGFACGRAYLSIGGYVVAMEGDVVRDFDLAAIMREEIETKYGGGGTNDLAVLASFGDRATWTTDLIKFVATQANGGKLP